jgi:hypothetical protein
MIIDLSDRFHTPEFIDSIPARTVNRTTRPFQNIILHHTTAVMSASGIPMAYGIRTDGGATTRQQEENAILGLARDHRARFGIGPGYYYVGFHSGRFYAVGKVGTERRHTSNTDGRIDGRTWNYDSMAVCLFGNFNAAQPSEAMKQGLTQVIAQIMSWPFTAQDVRIMGHRDANPRTECPGDNAMRLILPPPADHAKHETIRAHVTEIRTRLDAIEALL